MCGLRVRVRWPSRLSVTPGPSDAAAWRTAVRVDPLCREGLITFSAYRHHGLNVLALERRLRSWGSHHGATPRKLSVMPASRSSAWPARRRPLAPRRSSDSHRGDSSGMRVASLPSSCCRCLPTARQGSARQAVPGQMKYLGGLRCGRHGRPLLLSRLVKFPTVRPVRPDRCHGAHGMVGSAEIVSCHIAQVMALLPGQGSGRSTVLTGTRAREQAAKCHNITRTPRINFGYSPAQVTVRTVRSKSGDTPV